MRIQVENSDISLTGGVLIIGSLLWEKSKIRKTWQSEYLDMQHPKDVPAPIRYGKISKSRHGNYTMVFSNEYKVKKKFGNAKFLPFINAVNLDDLHKQAAALMKAEYNNNDSDPSKYYWDWGTLGLCINPQSRGIKAEPIKNLIASWKAKYGKNFHPEKYKCKSEALILTPGGLLKIKWPHELDEYDLLIATQTKPEEIPPLPEDIAKIMLDTHYQNYFQNNFDAGITTYDDGDIIKALNMANS